MLFLSVRHDFDVQLGRAVSLTAKVWLASGSSTEVVDLGGQNNLVLVSGLGHISSSVCATFFFFRGGKVTDSSYQVLRVT